jgi:hypothetical protein
MPRGGCHMRDNQNQNDQKTITQRIILSMTDELKNRIRNFIVSWDNTIDDEFMGLADYDLFLETAIELLEESIKDG